MQRMSLQLIAITKSLQRLNLIQSILLILLGSFKQMNFR